jgi:hypothetical protein
MEFSWPVNIDYCNEDGARCYVTARKTNRQYLCQKCLLVNDFLVRKNELCAVCFRKERLAIGDRFCIGTPCFDKYHQHLVIQTSKPLSSVSNPVDPWSETHFIVSVARPSVHPLPLQDHAGSQDGCSTLGVLTATHTPQAASTSTVEAGACSQLPAPAEPPQNHLQDEQLISTLNHLLQEVSSAKQEPRLISGNLELILSELHLWTGVANSMANSFHSSARPVVPHSLGQQ